MAAPLDEAPENRRVTTKYPRRKPNPFGDVIRWLWGVIQWLRDMIEGRPPAVMTEYPRRKPNPILHLIRWVSVVLVLYVILRGIVALYGLLVWGNVPALDGLLVWGVPFVLAFGYLAFILFRNRRQRAHR